MVRPEEIRPTWARCAVTLPAPCAPACSPRRSRRCCCRRRRRPPATRSCPCRRCAPACSARATRSCTGRRSPRSASRSSTSSTATPAGRARGCSCACPGPPSTATGVGPGFSGSPIYCRDEQGTDRNAGAISESLGEYGGDVVLATPIEAILGTPVDAAHGPRASRRDRALMARAKPLATPLTVTGVSAALGRALERAGAQGRPPGDRGARRPARHVRPAADAPGRRGRRLLLDGRHPGRRDRDGRLHRRGPRVGVRPPVRERRRAASAAPGRLRLPRDRQPGRDPGRGVDLQVRVAGPHARHDLQRRARRRRRPHRRAAADGADPRLRQRPRHRPQHGDRHPGRRREPDRAARRAPRRCPSSRRSRSPRPPARCCAARPAG